VDVTTASFDADVVQRSHERPVVVDFWADWCGPCHALAPVLEAAVAERHGAIDLAKVDIEAEQELGALYGVSSIPAVKAFRDGRVVSEFTGVRSPTAVETFLDELLAPPRAEGLVAELRERGELPDVVAALDAGDVEEALRVILDLVPGASPEERERLREVAVALFDHLGQDDPVTVAYRRRLATSLY
jgi:putative thioredoxin